MTDVGIILRPQAEIVYHRLEDKLQQLKEYLLSTYGTAIGVHLVRPRQNVAAQAPSQASSEQTGTQQTEVALAGAARSEDIIPLEQTLIDLFSARRASAPRK
jgi:hypothetical protein